MNLMPPQSKQLPMRQAESDSFDYTANASAYVPDGDAIVYVGISAKPSGDGELMVSRISVAGTIITFWLSGGQPGRLYTVHVEGKTAQARDFSEAVLISVGLALSSGPVPSPPSAGFGDPVVWTAAIPMGLDFSRPLSVSTVAAS